jgi:hypothetical protein
MPKSAIRALTPNGGQGQLIAAHWTCPDVTKVSGMSVLCSTPTGTGTVHVTAWNSAGNSVSSQAIIQ